LAAALSSRRAANSATGQRERQDSGWQQSGTAAGCDAERHRASESLGDRRDQARSQEAALSLLDLSRWQFAITVMFHMTFPAITVGLSILLCALYGMHWRTGNPVYRQMFRFWRRIFAVGFAIGVVAGIVITFEMGLNWGIYAAKTGPIIGPIIGMEVVTAFFVEAGFIGILLYGDGRVGRGTMFAATVMVAIGTLLSSSWIIAANSWMQTPAGFAMRDGRFEPTNWMDTIFNPSFIWRWPHMLIAVLISASFFVAGIGAWYLVKGRALAFARRSVSIGLGVAAILVPVFYATILRFRRKLWTSRRFHRFLLWTTPAGILAILGGWVTAETGRQPWLVFGEVLFSVVGFVLLYLVMLAAYIALLIDEPSTSLDTSTGAHVLAAVRDRLPHAVLVLAMHEPPADPHALGSAWSTVSLD
jgi:cytochrome bd-type quinol oxidase subunit 1